MQTPTRPSQTPSLSHRSAFWRRRIALLFIALLLSSCAFLTNLLGRDDQKDDDLMKLLMLGILSQQTTATCQNTSGFVICIPKGVTFQ